MAEAEKQPEALGVSAAPPPAQEPAADQPEAAAPGADSKSDLELHKDAPPAPEAKVQPERESTFQDYAVRSRAVESMVFWPGFAVRLVANSNPSASSRTRQSGTLLSWSRVSLVPWAPARYVLTLVWTPSRS